MQVWQHETYEILRQSSARAIRTCDFALHDATLNAIDAMRHETGDLPVDLLIYEMVMRELRGESWGGG